MDKEQIFKESIANNLNGTLVELGYSRTHENMGIIEYSNLNNILVFVFEWNESHGFYCKLGFTDELIDYPLSIVLNRLKNSTETETYKFGAEFTELMNNWTISLASEIREQKICELTKNSKAITELKIEFEQRTREYNRQLEQESLKRKADEAWNSKDYQNFITTLKGKLELLPSSYSKKLSIAKKWITEKEGL